MNRATYYAQAQMKEHQHPESLKRTLDETHPEPQKEASHLLHRLMQ